MAGNKAFGKRIRDLREAKKRSDPRFTLRQFAEMVGISPTFLSKVETGEFDPPKAVHIKKMAALLGADADELLALAGKVDPDLDHIILGAPKAMADFLRSARGLTPEQLAKLAEQARKERDQEPDQP